MDYSEFLAKHREPVVTLYRGFDKKEHMDMFLAGQIRLGLFKYYRELPAEDTRLNKQEGILFYPKVKMSDGTVKEYVTWGFASPHYVSCWATDPSSVVGKFIVRLDNPTEFHKRMIDFLGYGNRHYSGKMVNPTGIMFDDGKCDTNLLTLYSDTNSSKNEYRFSYWMLQNLTGGQLQLPFCDGESKFITPKGKIVASNDPNISMKRDKYIPHFFTLNGVLIKDICTTFLYLIGNYNLNLLLRSCGLN